jgi:hypothetical protein
MMKSLLESWAMIDFPAHAIQFHKNWPNNIVRPGKATAKSISNAKQTPYNPTQDIEDAIVIRPQRNQFDCSQNNHTQEMKHFAPSKQTGNGAIQSPGHEFS